MRVLLADDGSPGAGRGIALASSIAWPQGAVLRVASVIEPLQLAIAGPWSGAIAPSPDVEAAIAAHVGEVNRSATERLAAPHLDLQGVLLRGRAASAIVDEAAARVSGPGDCRRAGSRSDRDPSPGFCLQRNCRPGSVPGPRSARRRAQTGPLRDRWLAIVAGSRGAAGRMADFRGRPDPRW